MLLTPLLIAVAAVLSAPLLARAFGRNAGFLLAPILLASAFLLVAAGGFTASPQVEQTVTWLPTLGVGLALRLDGLSLVFGLIVTVIGAAVMAYSARYLGTGSRHGVFYTLMTTFAAAMLLLVLADDLIVMFIAWEFTTLCSFFLISRSHAGRQPAQRTLLVTAGGGISLLAAVCVMAVGTGTTRISEVLASDVWGTDPGFVAAVAVLLAVAAFTKSAQFPFQSWLPDSMVAITPVSSYLHAAAMVKAGIYVMLRFSPGLAGQTVWMTLLISAGVTTALIGGIAALRRHDLKELLAYSTISQLGMITAMIGVGTKAALTAAVAHTIAHALFKAALFMMIGVMDHEAGTRDIRQLAHLRLRMPVSATVLGLAVASMAGIPLLLGFASKEKAFDAFLGAPGPSWLPAIIIVAVAGVAICTFSYSARILIGAFSGRGERVVGEASAALLGAPLLLAAAGLPLGAAPFLLNPLVSSATSAVIGEHTVVELALWYGFNGAVVTTIVVFIVGSLLVWQRARVDAFLADKAFPFKGLDAVEGLRAGIIRLGGTVGSLAGTRCPRRHLTVVMVCLIGMASLGLPWLGSLPAQVGNPSRLSDWVLVLLVASGVVAGIFARTRIAAVVVTGVVGLSMTLWYFQLGAVDVAVTQLLVEVLTVCVMVLLLSRLPARFVIAPTRDRIRAAVLGVAAGLAAGIGVFAFTGRRGPSQIAEYYLTQGETVTSGANLVATILVDFRALDTMGEFVVLGVAGLTIAALLQSRRPSPLRPAGFNPDSPLADARQNAVFVMAARRMLTPIIVVMSAWLFFRGHQEPGGGFIAALVGGAGIAMYYLAAPTAAEARLRWPWMKFIGAGIVIGVGTGLAGFLKGSFLTPLTVDVFGIKLSSVLLFDVGVYLAVVGLVLAAFNLLGRQHPKRTRDHFQAVPEKPEKRPVHRSVTTVNTEQVKAA